MHNLLDVLRMMDKLLQELGGNTWWVDRFLAQHVAAVYYIMTVLMYVISPRMACKYTYLVFTVSGELDDHLLHDCLVLLPQHDIKFIFKRSLYHLMIS
jgi:hypothetical protein